MTQIFGIYGASGCGRGIMPLARAQLADTSEAELVFIDDRLVGERVNGHAVLDFEAFCAHRSDARHVAVAMADPGARELIALRCAAAGLPFFEIRAPNCIEMDCVSIGEGALISPFVTFTSNIRIGRHFHANLYSYVEHDCVLGDFVTFAPGVRCNGNVHIGDGAYIGSGAVLRQGRPDSPLLIGAGAVVGMGAVVTRNVEPGVTVVGNPARSIEHPRGPTKF